MKPDRRADLPRLASLPDAIGWLREHADDRPAPLRLHDHETDHQGALGTPRYTGAFLAFLVAEADDVRDTDDLVECGHFHDATHPPCTITRAYYRSPMWRALRVLGRKSAIRPGHPKPLTCVVAIMWAGWDWRLAARHLRQPPERFEALALMAIRTLHGLYAVGPVPQRSWISLSDSQRTAIEANGAA